MLKPSCYVLATYGLLNFWRKTVLIGIQTSHVPSSLFKINLETSFVGYQFDEPFSMSLGIESHRHCTRNITYCAQMNEHLLKYAVKYGSLTYGLGMC